MAGHGRTWLDMAGHPLRRSGLGNYIHDSLNDRGLGRVAGDDDAVGGQGLMGAEPEGPVVLSAAGADFPLPPSMQPAARTEGAGDGGRDARVGDKASAPAGPALAAPLLVPVAAIIRPVGGLASPSLTIANAVGRAVRLGTIRRAVLGVRGRGGVEALDGADGVPRPLEVAGVETLVVGGEEVGHVQRHWMPPLARRVGPLEGHGLEVCEGVRLGRQPVLDGGGEQLAHKAGP